MNIEKIVEQAIESLETYESFKFSIANSKNKISLKLFDKWVDAMDLHNRRVKYIVDLFEANLLSDLSEKTYKILKNHL